MKRIGHCADGYHAYCGGYERDRGDGTMIECECNCHKWTRMEESWDVQAKDYNRGGYDDVDHV